MNSLRFRPTFSIRTDWDAAETIKRVRQQVNKHTGVVQGQYTNHHVMISFTQSHRHFWSPWLHLEIRNEIDGERDGSELFGRFSPHPSIWTAIMMSYLSLGVLSFFSLMMGMSQQLADELPWGYFVIPVWMLIALSMWIVSQIGQRLATTQMHKMNLIVQNIVDDSHRSER